MTVSAIFLTVLAVLESTLPSFCLSYKIKHNEATAAVLTVLAVSAVMAVSVMTLVSRAIRNAIRANRFARIIRN